MMTNREGRTFSFLPFFFGAAPHRKFFFLVFYEMVLSFSLSCSQARAIAIDVRGASATVGNAEGLPPASRSPKSFSGAHGPVAATQDLDRLNTSSAPI